MRRALLRVLLTAASLATPLTAEGRPQAYPERAPLPAQALQDLRGGFELPGGMIVTMGVTTQTSIDGREALRTVLRVNGPDQTLATYADTGNGLVLIPADTAIAGVQTALGNVRVNNGVGQASVRLSGSDIDVSHLLGGALGSIVANQANNRTIDVQTTVDVTVSGVRPEMLGGGISAINNLAADAATRLAH